MEKEKSYVSGIIGGIIGGFIASIPWVVMYVYGNMILSILATLVAFGVIKGYQIFKGKEDSKLPIIVAIISVIVITVATFLIIPACLLANEGYAISSYNFSLLFSSSEFMSAIVKDYVVSLIFTTLGISGVIANLKKKFQPQNIDQNSTKPQSNIQDANNVPQQNQSENSNQK